MSQCPPVVLRVAFDVGNVIIINHRRPSDECIAAVAYVVDMVGPQNAYIVSKGHHRMQKQTLECLTACDFFTRTGMLPANVMFTLDRSTQEELSGSLRLHNLRLVQGATIEGPVCAPAGFGKGALACLFDLHILIDDKAECLEDFARHSVEPRPLLLQALFTDEARPSRIAGHIHCRSWSTVELHVRSEFLKRRLTSSRRRQRERELEAEAEPKPKKMPKQR